MVLSSARRPGRTWSTGHPPWGMPPLHVGSAGCARRHRPPRGRGGVSPVPRAAFWPFNTHYAGEFFGTRSRIRGAFRGLRLNLRGSALSWSASRRVCVTTLARVSLPLQTGQLLAPFQGLCCSASTAGSLQTPGAALPGTLASPRTRLPLAGCPELVARVAAIDHPLSGFVDVRPPGCWTHQADVKWRAVSGPAARERGGVRRGAEGPTFLQKGRMPHLLEQSSPSLRAGDEAGGCQGPHECQSKPDRSGHWRPCDGFRDSLLGNNS